MMFFPFDDDDGGPIRPTPMQLAQASSREPRNEREAAVELSQMPAPTHLPRIAAPVRKPRHGRFWRAFWRFLLSPSPWSR